MTSRSDALDSPRENLLEWIECEEFYNLMQEYRHAPVGNQEATLTAYRAVKGYIADLVLEELKEQRSKTFTLCADCGCELECVNPAYDETKAALARCQEEVHRLSPPRTGGIHSEFAQIAKFYAVDNMVDLVRMQEHHIKRLQAKLPPIRDTEPKRVRKG